MGTVAVAVRCFFLFVLLFYFIFSLFSLFRNNNNGNKIHTPRIPTPSVDVQPRKEPTNVYVTMNNIFGINMLGMPLK